MSTIHNATNAVIVPNDPTDTTIPVATVMEITPIVPTTPTPISDPAIAAAAKANADKANKAAASSCDARERWRSGGRGESTRKRRTPPFDGGLNGGPVL